MASEGSKSYEKTSFIRGHDIYKFVWTPFIGEELVVPAEDGNKHAVAVIKNGCVVGHVPRCIFQVSWSFLKRGGHILCHATRKGKLGVGLESAMPQWECINTRIGVTPSASTRRLFETWHLLFMWLNLDPAYKSDQRLFEGGFYLRIYSTYSVQVYCIAHLIINYIFRYTHIIIKF